MNVPETDIDIPMPHIVSNSPTHSLPNVSYSGLDAADAVPRTEAGSANMPAVEIVGPASELEQQSEAVFPSEESAITHTIPLPILQRAISTSPRLEHTTNSTQSPECRDSLENELLFFPLADISQDVDKTVSLSSGCIDQNGFVETRNNVRASDTVLSVGTSAHRGQMGSMSRERIRSGIRRVMRLSSQPQGSNVEHLESASRLRKDSATSSRSGNRYGSSIFGSKLFESMSTCSIGSQRINIVADSPSVEPVFSSHYSVSCDESSFPHGEPLSAEYTQEPFPRKTTRFRTTSASSDLQSERFSITDNSESMSLQRTRSLPLRHTTSTSDAQDEISDSVSELPPVASASTTKQRKWQMTMPELTEGPENETLSSHGQKRENLAAAALAIIRGEYKGWGIDDEQTTDKQLVTTDDGTLPVVSICLEKRRYIKNLLVMSAAYFFLFSAYFALRNLQSSLNAAEGLGLYALSSMYCALIFGSLFSTTVVQRLQPKRTIALSLIGFISYSAANFYPRFYTMIPASIVHGFFMAVGYTAQSTYLTNISAGYAELVGKQTKHVLSQFHGTYFVFLQFSQIAGGLISSLLLSRPGSHGNTESFYTSHDFFNGNYSLQLDNASSSTPFCGSSYCPSASKHIEMNSSVDLSTLLILMGCFAASTLTGCVILILFLDPLGGVMKKSTTRLSQQMTAVFRFFLQRRARLVIGLSFYSLLEVTFMFGEFTKAFITCVIGVHFVGFLMLTLSLSTGITAYISGNLQQYVGRMPLILTALCLHFALLLVMYFWSLSTQSVYLFFVIAATWGLADGMLITQIVSLLGSLFESNKEPAFAAHKMCQALSGFTLFMTAPYLCTAVKILVVMSVLVLALSGYVALEVLLKLQARTVDHLTADELVVSAQSTTDEGKDDQIKIPT